MSHFIERSMILKNGNRKKLFKMYHNFT